MEPTKQPAITLPINFNLLVSIKDNNKKMCDPKQDRENTLM